VADDRAVARSPTERELRRNEDAGFRRSTGVVDFRRKVPLTCDDTEMR
jgi:hypothetical protein